MNTIQKLFAIVLMTLTFGNAMAQSNFVSVKDGKLWKEGKPYYYVGANFWYGAILGSEGRGGNRQRLCRELDKMKSIGITNLRVLVGSDGEEGVMTKVEPTLQRKPGVYNDSILAGLDYLLQQMGKRKMVAVLYLNNSWEWSGGYGFYLEHAGAGKAPRPNEEGYNAYTNFVKNFSTNAKAHQLFYDYVKFIMSRTNRYTGKRYVDDNAIMAWQIGNEPRPFSTENIPAFETWLKEVSALMRGLDKNHLISIGSEGVIGCEGDVNAFRTICSDPNIDYVTVHVWPYNWGWAHKETLGQDVKLSCEKTKDYLNQSLQICQELQKPLVMEEFGYPRDGFSFAKSSTTAARDTYYKYVFDMIIQMVGKNKGGFSGCNIWAWGGNAVPKHEQWLPGDDYTGDPAQEQQGLNSVFSSDASTLHLIKTTNHQLKKLTRN